MNVVFFDEFDAWGSFMLCLQYVGDKDYCKKAVELLAEAQTRRVFTYGGRMRFHAVLPYIRRSAMATDKERRAVVIFLDIIGTTAVLFYERSGGDFRLKFVDWITTELKALKNPHPQIFTQHI